MIQYQYCNVLALMDMEEGGIRKKKPFNRRASTASLYHQGDAWEPGHIADASGSHAGITDAMTETAKFVCTA